jgi:hypothetical protein
LGTKTSVDALLILDLTAIARERAIASALGDEGSG